MNSDFFVDVTSLYNAINSLGLAKDNLSDLYTSLNNVNTSDMDGLSGKSVFKSNRQKVLKIYSNYDDSVCAIYRRIKELKEQVCMLDSANAMLFQMLENGSVNDEFGSFVNGDVDLDEEKILTIQEQYNEYADIDQDLLTQAQWTLIQSNNEYLNGQIAVIDNQINQLSSKMAEMIDTWGPGVDISAIQAQLAVLGQQKKNLDAFVYKEDKTYLEQAGSDIAISFNTVLSDLKNEGLGASFESGKDFINLLQDTGSEIVEKAQASVANFAIATAAGVGNFVEALFDAAIIILSSVGAGAFDVAEGIANSDWDFSHVKNNLDDVRAIVSKEVVNGWYDKLYDTNLGQTLDEKSFDFFSSGGTGTEFGKGLGYSLGVIGLTVATCGTATPVMLATTAGVAGFGKYTSEAWNSNSMTLTDLSGNVTSVSLNSNDYQQIQDLNFGESITINELSIIKNVDGSYSVSDANGNQYNVSEFDYTSNAEGLVKGTVNAGWEALQYGIGGKIGTSTFGLNSKVAVSGIRVGLDGLTGAVEVPFQAAQMMMFDDMTWNDSWNAAGGWKSVYVQTALGGALSSFGEIGDVFKKADVDVNASSVVSSNLKDSSLRPYSNTDIQFKLDRYNELMKIANSPEYIQYMDYGRRGWAQELRPEFDGVQAELSSLKAELDASSVTLKNNVSSNKYVTNTPEFNIREIIRRHDGRYRMNDALERLKAFTDPSSSDYGNYNVITSSMNARSILQMYTPEGIRKGLINLGYISDSSVVSTSGINFANKSLESNLKEIMNRHDWKYGEGDALVRLTNFINSSHVDYGNYMIITGSFDARSILQMYTPEGIRKGLINLGYVSDSSSISGSMFDFKRNSIDTNISEILSRHDGKYGKGDALKRLIEFSDPAHANYGNYRSITSSDNARAILELYSPQQIRDALINLGYVKRSSSIPNFFKELGNSGDSFGCNQGGIADLCVYVYDGKYYSYREAMQIYNDALNDGRPVPHFEKRATQEYMELKNKLISQGYTPATASVIMSTVDDAGACSYAATVNEIFAAFIGREQEFYQRFGYPMFREVDGVKVLNSNELLLDLYVFCNNKKNGGKLLLDLKTLNFKYLLDNRRDVFGRRMLDAEEQVYLSGLSTGKNSSVISKFLSSKGLNYNSTWLFSNPKGVKIDNRAFDDLINNVISEFNSGKSISLGIYQLKQNGKTIGNTINMISTNKGLYPSISTRTWKEGGGHAVFVTNIDSKGFYVSSWGQEFLIPFSDLKNGGIFNVYVADIQ